MFSKGKCGEHVWEQGVGVAYDKHAAHERVYEPPIKALLQVMQHVLLVHVQEVAHVRERLRAYGVRSHKLRVSGSGCSSN